MIIIDTIYQRVLAIANKEQRGYITPQEFNLFANQAQIDIFEQYFYDINQFGNIPENATEYSNIEDLTDEKLGSFKHRENAPSNLGGSLWLIPNYVYKFGTVKYQQKYIVDEIKEDQLMHVLQSPLTTPTKTRPAYVRFAHNITGQNVFEAYPNSLNSQISFTYIRKPNTVNWGYAVINDKALYDATTSINFELHPSEEKELVLKILALAGIMIKDAGLYQTASSEEQKNIQQEKQ
tara:strand:+ start:1005 stop:1712 length:708 start_codon:yes stop_codon:yes gene_type:complete